MILSKMNLTLAAAVEFNGLTTRGACDQALRKKSQDNVPVPVLYLRQIM